MGELVEEYIKFFNLSANIKIVLCQSGVPLLDEATPPVSSEQNPIETFFLLEALPTSDNDSISPQEELKRLFDSMFKTMDTKSLECWKKLVRPELDLDRMKAFSPRTKPLFPGDPNEFLEKLVYGKPFSFVFAECQPCISILVHGHMCVPFTTGPVYYSSCHQDSYKPLKPTISMELSIPSSSTERSDTVLSPGDIFLLPYDNGLAVYLGGGFYIWPTYQILQTAESAVRCVRVLKGGDPTKMGIGFNTFMQLYPDFARVELNEKLRTFLIKRYVEFDRSFNVELPEMVDKGLVRSGYLPDAKTELLANLDRCAEPDRLLLEA